MHLCDGIVQNLSALFEKIIDCPCHHAFIPRYRCGGDCHGIAGDDMYLTVVAVGDAYQCGSWFSLSTGGNKYDAIRR